MLLLMSGWLELWLIYEFMDLFLDCGFMDLFLVESLERSSVITCRWKSLSTMFLLLSKLLGPVLPVATVTVCTLLDSITLLNTRTMNTTRVSTARKLAVSYTKVFVLEVEGMKTCLLTLISDSSSSSAPFSIASAISDAFSLEAKDWMWIILWLHCTRFLALLWSDKDKNVLKSILN